MAGELREKHTEHWEKSGAIQNMQISEFRTVLPIVQMDFSLVLLE